MAVFTEHELATARQGLANARQAIERFDDAHMLPALLRLAKTDLRVTRDVDDVRASRLRDVADTFREMEDGSVDSRVLSMASTLMPSLIRHLEAAQCAHPGVISMNARDATRAIVDAAEKLVTRLTLATVDVVEHKYPLVAVGELPARAQGQSDRIVAKAQEYMRAHHLSDSLNPVWDQFYNDLADQTVPGYQLPEFIRMAREAGDDGLARSLDGVRRDAEAGRSVA
jgi:hypothetical protein